MFFSPCRVSPAPISYSAPIDRYSSKIRLMLYNRHQKAYIRCVRNGREFIENADSAFRNGKSEREKELEKEQDELYKQLGKLHAANDFLKKNLKKQGLLQNP